MLLGQYVFSVLLPATVRINMWHNKDGRKRKKKRRENKYPLPVIDTSNIGATK